MNVRYFVAILTLVLSIFVDQVSKQWALSLSTLHFNQGFIMGLYRDLPEGLRIVTLGCFAGIVFFIYVFLMYILPSRAGIMKFALSLMVGGMFGNVLDKIMLGKTIDFIPFNYFGMHFVFNVADVFLWSGSLMILFIIFRQEKLIWYPDSNRGNYLINPREQFKIGLNFTLMIFSAAIILGIFSYTFFNTTVSHFIAEKNNLMITFFITFSMITLFLCTLGFMAGIIIGHRSAGPIYAFEMFVNDIIQGKDRKLKFRDGDNYKELEEVAERLRTHVFKD